MAKRKIRQVDTELNRLLKQVNKREQILTTSRNVIYLEQTRAELQRLHRIQEKLTGTTGHFKRGNITNGLIPQYKAALQRFLQSDLSTITGQNRIMERAKAKYEEDYGAISEEDYKKLTKLFDSDQFKKFKEKYGTYSNILDTLGNSKLSYSRMKSFIDVMVQDDSNMFFSSDGSLNSAAFEAAYNEINRDPKTYFNGRDFDMEALKANWTTIQQKARKL